MIVVAASSVEVRVNRSVVAFFCSNQQHHYHATKSGATKTTTAKTTSRIFAHCLIFFRSFFCFVITMKAHCGKEASKSESESEFESEDPQVGNKCFSLASSLKNNNCSPFLATKCCSIKMLQCLTFFVFFLVAVCIVTRTKNREKTAL